MAIERHGQAGMDPEEGVDAAVAPRQLHAGQAGGDRAQAGQPYPSMVPPARFRAASLGTSSKGNSARSQ